MQTLTPESIGIGGATVTPEVGIGTCDATHDLIHVWSDVSEHGGYYFGAGFEAQEELGDLCIRVRALPPDSTTYLPSDWIEMTLDDVPDIGLLTLHFYLRAP